jgi:hypothetical protein
MLLNLSNHPSTRWSEEQRERAIKEYHNIQDMSFPNVPPAATAAEIKTMAADYVQQIRGLAKAEGNQPFAVHIMGEMTLIFRVVSLLKRSKITCVASTSERNSIENADGSKTMQFKFIQFREYV